MEAITVHLPQKRKIDYYSLDNQFLNNDIKSHEMFQISKSNPIFLSFLLLRGLLYKSNFDRKPTIEKFDLALKKKIYKMNFMESMNSIFEGVESYYPTNLNLIQESPFLGDSSLENQFFSVRKILKNKYSYAYGTILSNENTNIHMCLEKILKNFNLRQKQGSIYLRTNHSSYFYKLEPFQKNTVLFVQEKKILFKPFLFFYIDATPI
jgi:hypothetical protein